MTSDAGRGGGCCDAASSAGCVLIEGANSSESYWSVDRSTYAPLTPSTSPTPAALNDANQVPTPQPTSITLAVRSGHHERHDHVSGAVRFGGLLLVELLVVRRFDLRRQSTFRAQDPTPSDRTTPRRQREALRRRGFDYATPERCRRWS